MTEGEPAAAKAVRVQKFLSQAGLVSRREAERLIALGKVRVNDRVVNQQGVKVVPGVDRVFLNGSEVQPAERRWIVFHKPPGVLTTRSDPHGGKTVYDVLPAWASGLRYVGRLDRETSGLLVMTNDGDLAAKMAHPRAQVEREYLVTVRGSVTARVLRALKAGVQLEDGIAKPKRVRRVRLGEATSELSLILTEGRKREVRRMMLAVGHPVVSLVRVAFGPFELGRLGSGSWRAAHSAEMEALADWLEPKDSRGQRRPKNLRRGRK
ncbi:MAG: pseudouridine synthase [Longimicrobiales bacterium]